MPCNMWKWKVRWETKLARVAFYGFGLMFIARCSGLLSVEVTSACRSSSSNPISFDFPAWWNSWQCCAHITHRLRIIDFPFNSITLGSFLFACISITAEVKRLKVFARSSRKITSGWRRKHKRLIKCNATFLSMRTFPTCGNFLKVLIAGHRREHGKITVKWGGKLIFCDTSEIEHFKWRIDYWTARTTIKAAFHIWNIFVERKLRQSFGLTEFMAFIFDIITWNPRKVKKKFTFHRFYGQNIFVKKHFISIHEKTRLMTCA